MRILAVRGCNLASLADSWEIDFDAEPLASAGIFAITGPTGAGKSTLLDSMCLALFNTLPRLGAAARAQIGGEGGDAIGAKDPRSILRHGTGEGFAEVDFVGRDRRRYRARWAVRRARGRPTGALQEVRQTLLGLDSGEPLGGTRTETLAIIRDLVGLTGEQFTRAVMLAQGEFDAFVKADANERALLLERLTGSEIYARLGAAAFAKARGLAAELEALRTRIADQQGLDDTQRATAEQVLGEATEVHRAAAERLAAIQAVRAWDEKGRHLADLVERCEAAVREALAAGAEAEPRRERLRRSRIAFAMVPEWGAAAEAEARASRSALAVTERETGLDEARQAEVAARAEEEEAQEKLREGETEAKTLEPVLAAARELDRRITEAGQLLAERTANQATRRDAADQAQSAHQRAGQACSKVQAERDSEAAWIQDNQALAGLALREAELIENLSRLNKALEQAAGLEEAIEGAGRQAEEAAAQAAAEAKRREEAQAELDRARAEVAAAEEAAPAAATLAALNERRDRLAALPRLISEAAAAQARLAGSRTQVEKLAEAQERLARAAAEQVGRRDEIGRDLPALRAARDEAERARALSSAAADEAAARMREALVAGEPCPVCGATEHALETVDRLIADRLDQDRERFGELEGQVRDLEREDAVLADRLDGTSESQSSTAAEQQAALDAVDEETGRHAGALTALEAATEAAGLPFDGASPLADFRLDVNRQIAAAGAERERLVELQSALDSARRREVEFGRACEAARNAAFEASQAANEAGQRRLNLESELREVRRQLDRLDQEVDGHLSPYFNWRKATDAAVEVSAKAAEWRDRNKRRDELADKLARLTEAAHSAELDRKTAAVALASTEREVADLEERYRREREEREALLDGDPTESVRERLDGRLGQARERLEDARQARESRARSRASAESALTEAHGTGERDHDDAVRRRRQFQARLDVLALDEALVAEVAAAGSEPLDEEQAELEAIGEAVRNARSALATRGEDLTAHTASERPSFEGDDTAAELKSAALAESEAREKRDEAAFVIRRDDDARDRTAALRAEHAEASGNARIWLRLGALIGSQKGDLFRRFAQGLTLDRLVAQANVRLAELKPRYELERGQGGDMLIQVVDHDLGGDVRGLHNLSGGERFLVSLALALGLSEMSTGRGLVIESLFIDEGFGSLDGQSLGAAIDLLEQLHATGRRVGIISHIDEVKERIPVKIEVTEVARGRSTIAVVGA